jgi:DDE superfamily endonuclease/Helix-turn-helix of DDE superfamily endonuclease
MGMKLIQIATYPEDKVRALFGLTSLPLGELFAVALPELLRRREQQQQTKLGRKRKVGGGRKRLLKPYQEVLLTLIYLRHNVAFCVVGALFGVSADVAENTFHEVVAVLREVCPKEQWNAKKRWQKGQPSWEPGEEDKVLIDSFETPVPRPSEKQKQKRLYSGKKKRHTLKTQVITDQNGELLDIDPGHRGPMSDKRLYEQSEVETQFPDAAKQADLGYLGLPTVLTPHKKPKGGELTEEQKEENRQFAAARVRVEHGIRRLKGFGILRDPYRLATGLFPRIASATAGLVQLQRLLG